ncbi:phosphatidylglycerol lysyltransferase domain-containing protein [Arthrobacter alpinus]|uniref:phosphatidylglycerol lysyltransferase domain-containing protein n=1 Tax=Arthrobacter alpinus TaxID=656366 RepID=UPI0016494DE9|nr:rhomboid family intramembrane serine protease [Arthrobacter alpinus]
MSSGNKTPPVGTLHGELRRRGGLARAAGTWVRRVPFTLAVIVLTLVVRFGFGSPLGNLHTSVSEPWGFQSRDLLDGQWWSIVTTMFLSANPGALLAAIVVLAGVLGLAETTMRTWRTAVLFFSTQLVAVVLFALTVEVGVAADMEWLTGMSHASLLGPFAAAVGTLMAASRMISVMWRRRVRALTMAAAVMLSLYVGHAQNLVILLGAVVGLVLGMAVVPAPGRSIIARSTSREVRTNLAIVVAVFAMGPLIAALVHAPVGPLAVLRNLILNPVPTLTQIQGSCTAAERGCQALAHGSGLLGPGGHLLALMPVLLLLVCAEGLRRGNRFALWTAVYLHLVIGVVSGIYLQVFAGFGLPVQHGHRVISFDASLWEVLPVVLVPFLIAALLVVFRRHFHIDPDPALRRRAFLLLPLLLGVFVALYAAAWVAEGNANGQYGLIALVASLPRILLPYPFPFSYGAAVYPHGFFSMLLFSVGGAVLWLASLLSVLALVLSRRVMDGSPGSDKAKAARLVRRGGDSLSWMTQWPNNDYWFNATGSVAIAYQEHYGVAVTVGGPIGERDHFESALDEFLDHCGQESLTPCLYSLTDELWTPLRERGFRRVAVASETLLDIQSMEFKGKDWQNVRTALNKAAKLHITAQWSRYSELPTGMRTQIHEISEEWVSGRALPEMGFTLGGVNELKDDAVVLCLAVDEGGRIHGVTSWLPVYSNGDIVSWTLDFMRRNTDAFNGVMEFLIAEAVLHFKDQVSTISLSGSPLSTNPDTEAAADADADADGAAWGAAREAGGPREQEPLHPFATLEDSSMERILGLLARTLEPVYGFASLAHFKSRFQPRHRTLYMMYQDALSLPAIGRAVGEAYMPNVSVRQLARLLRKS